MKDLRIIFSCILISTVAAINVQAAGLDEIYRDLVRSDNRGYLPLFVKNRHSMEFIEDKEDLQELSKKTLPEVADIPELKDVHLENERLIRDEEIKKEQKIWQQVQYNVQRGYVSSFELDELSTRAEAGNPHAIEILAWIYAKGIGVKPDLVKAFYMYKQAAELQVPKAVDNAAAVYKAMTPAQRSMIE